MTQEEILEYNKRCAEFLTITNGYFPEEIEAKNQQFSHLCTYANTAYAFDKDAEPNKTVWDYLEFHSNWNWIMEVVEAIEKLYSSKFYVSILESECVIIDKEAAGNEENPFMIKPIAACNEAESKKEAVVEATNQFLIWYAKNK